MFSKIINALLIGLGASKVISIALGPGDMERKVAFITRAYTGFDPRDNSFVITRAIQGWAPVGAAVGVGKAIGYLRRHFPVR